MRKTKLRSEETFTKYSSAPKKEGCVLCSIKPIRLFTLWKIIPNEYPYDAIADKHDMLVPIRHTNELDIDETLEFEQIVKDLIEEGEYEAIMKNFPKNMTVPAHTHSHLLVFTTIALSSNGRTADLGPAYGGSNPSEAAC